MRITGKGLTATLLEALWELERGARRSALRKLRGKVRFDLPMDSTRE